MNRFDIVGAYYLYFAKFGQTVPIIAAGHLKWINLAHSRALSSFHPSLTLSRATCDASRSYVYGQRLPKNDDYQGTRDTYARLLRRARAGLRRHNVNP